MRAGETKLLEKRLPPQNTLAENFFRLARLFPYPPTHPSLRPPPFLAYTYPPTHPPPLGLYLPPPPLLHPSIIRINSKAILLWSKKLNLLEQIAMEVAIRPKVVNHICTF